MSDSASRPACPPGWIFCIAILLAIMVGPACGRAGDANPEAGTGIAVTVQPARIETVRDAVLAPGTIVPAAAGDFTVTASEAGEIAELPKAEGDAVQTGDVLVRFEIPAVTNEINARQIEVTAATTRVETARAEAKRLTSLHEKGLTPRNTMEASRAALTDAEMALTQVQALLNAVKAQEQRTTARARFAGIVAKVWRTKGEFVAVPGEPILRVIDPNRVQVLMHLPLSDFQRVIPGQAASVQPPGGPSFTAMVVMRTSPADPKSATAEVRLDPGTRSSLPIDTPVQIEILIEERRDALTVPATALQRDSSSPFVWTAGDDGRAHRRDVRVGLVSAGRAQILSGLTAGERVIMTGIAELTEGTVIRVSITSEA